jgi:hypothetical protein
MVEVSEFFIPLIVPAITGLIVFVLRFSERTRAPYNRLALIKEN